MAVVGHRGKETVLGRARAKPIRAGGVFQTQVVGIDAGVTVLGRDGGAGLESPAGSDGSVSGSDGTR